jgi:hypothetical protein
VFAARFSNWQAECGLIWVACVPAVGTVVAARLAMDDGHQLEALPDHREHGLYGVRLEVEQVDGHAASPGHECFSSAAS